MSGSVSFLVLPMSIAAHLVALRKARDLTQQQVADQVGLHVNQIRRYEADEAQPSLEALKKIALGLHVSLDSLVFGDAERGPDDELKLQFEAISTLPPAEKRVVRELLEGMIIKYQTRRWDSTRDASGQ